MRKTGAGIPFEGHYRAGRQGLFQPVRSLAERGLLLTPLREQRGKSERDERSPQDPGLGGRDAIDDRELGSPK